MRVRDEIETPKGGWSVRGADGESKRDGEEIPRGGWISEREPGKVECGDCSGTWRVAREVKGDGDVIWGRNGEGDGDIVWG